MAWWFSVETTAGILGLFFPETHENERKIARSLNFRWELLGLKRVLQVGKKDTRIRSWLGEESTFALLGIDVFRFFVFAEF